MVALLVAAAIPSATATVTVTAVRGDSQPVVAFTSLTWKVVVEVTGLVYVVEVLFCITFPPVAASYHLNVGAVAPVVDAIVAVGICVPHCALFVAVTADGSGFTVIVVVGAGETVQPAEVMDAV
jgi:hypothetical protein